MWTSVITFASQPVCVLRVVESSQSLVTVAFLSNPRWKFSFFYRTFYVSKCFYFTGLIFRFSAYSHSVVWREIALLQYFAKYRQPRVLILVCIHVLLHIHITTDHKCLIVTGSIAMTATTGDNGSPVARNDLNDLINYFTQFFIIW